MLFYFITILVLLIFIALLSYIIGRRDRKYMNMDIDVNVDNRLKAVKDEMDKNPNHIANVHSAIKEGERIRRGDSSK